MIFVARRQERAGGEGGVPDRRNWVPWPGHNREAPEECVHQPPLSPGEVEERSFRLSEGGQHLQRTCKSVSIEEYPPNIAYSITGEPLAIINVN